MKKITAKNTCKHAVGNCTAWNNRCWSVLIKWGTVRIHCVGKLTMQLSIITWSYITSVIL